MDHRTTVFATRVFVTLAFATLAFATFPAMGQDRQSAADFNAAAREAFSVEDSETAHQHLTSSLQLARDEYAENPSWRGRYRLSRRLAAVAHEYLRAGELDDGLAVIGEAADLDVPLREGLDNGLASVAGGLNRQLAALDSEEQYALLHDWSMPTDSRLSVRILETLVPTQAPPLDFARAFGERPRDSSFPIASVGDLSGLFSSAWELVRAADEAGRLRRLTAELVTLANEKAVNAAHVLMLAQIVAAKRSDEKLLADLTSRLSALRDNRPRLAVSTNTVGFDDAWQYGYGEFDDSSEPAVDFNHFTVWSGAAWQGVADRPASRLGFGRIDRTGGHPAWGIPCIRRWVAPADGVASVTGRMHHPSEEGDGVRGRVVVAKSGLLGEWIAFDGTLETKVDSIEVKAGETIDFVVDLHEDSGVDTFVWMVQIRLETDGSQRIYDSVADFCGPNDKYLLADAVLAAACLGHDWLHPVAEGILKKLIENTYDADKWVNRPHEYNSRLIRPALRRMWGTAAGKRVGETSEGLLDVPNLKFWMHASHQTSEQHLQGYARETWLGHEGNIAHFAGAGRDALFFKYPLRGDFEFTFETQTGGRPGTDGGVNYGGIDYEVSVADELFIARGRNARIHRPYSNLTVRSTRTYEMYVGQPQFHRFTLAANSGRVTFLANGQPVWSNTANSNTANSNTANSNTANSNTENGGAAPWLALQARDDRTPIFRNFKITGDPVIPREVRIADDDRLRGWRSDFYGESLPQVFAPEEVGREGQEDERARISNPNFRIPYFLADDEMLATHILALKQDSAPGQTSTDWFAKDGVIHGRRRVPAEEADAVPSSHQPSPTSGRERNLDEVAQSRIYYSRPLQSGETISYEFYYEPGKREVHPALGRVAFLIEPAGVRLHWMTDGDREWTGLSEDNAVAVPFDRRGPKPLPLLANGWNRMTIKADHSDATLTLNDRLIYVRKLGPQADRTFGFYHDARRSAVEVRNVVMRGDWPERLPTSDIDNLAAVDNSQQSAADRDAVGSLFPEEYLADSVLQVARHAAGLADEARYAYLADWVLPGRGHSSLRMVGQFAPPPPPPADQQDLIGATTPIAFATTDSNRLQSGAQLVAPALELVNVARRLGRLDDLRDRLTSTDNRSDEEFAVQRSAMLALIETASGNFTAANRNVDALVEMAKARDEAKAIDRWPEMLAIWTTLRHSETEEVARELVEVLHEHVRQDKLGETDTWKHHLSTLAAVGRFRDEVEALGEKVLTEPLVQWQTVSHVSARSLRKGFPRSRWRRLPHRVDNVSAHDRDYLYFQSPLRGNFQVECDLASTLGRRESQLVYGGTFTLPWNSLTHVGSGDLREQSLGGELTPFTPRLTRPGDWMRCRLVVQDGSLKVYFNSRLVREQDLLNGSDPWLAIRTHWERGGAVRDLRITGGPVIPESIELASSPELSGWLPYNDESVGAVDADWRFESGELISQSAIESRSTSERPGSDTVPRVADAAGYDLKQKATTATKRLLHYHRPMLEDGSIEYEFYYEPEQSLLHPALDRLVFLLEAEGVRVHWATPGDDETIGFDRANATIEPQNRRGSERLPLMPSDWNRVRLTLTGDTVVIALNGQLIYERQLEPTNLRNFGLFCDASETEARVRNIIWRGNWPRKLPPLSQQELADFSSIELLAKKLPDLTEVVEIDFAKQGLPRTLVGVRSSGRSNPARDVRVLPDGLHISREGSAEYYVGLLFGIGGDFDITMSYGDFKANVAGGGGAAVRFYATFQNERDDNVAIKKAQHPNGNNYMQFAHSWNEGGYRLTDEPHADDGDSAVVRFCRRGEMVYCLSAEDESSPFRLRDQFDVPLGDLDMDGFRVKIDSWGGEATTSVVLKKVTVRAERILDDVGKRLAARLTPDEGSRTARYVRVDLPNVRQVLSLAEVEVFSNDKNVSVGKRATQSSTGWGGSAERAVDGNRNGHYDYAQSTTHTDREQNPWWEVDLGQSYDIDRVLVWNRFDYGWTRLRGFRLQLLDPKRNVVWEQTPPDPSAAGIKQEAANGEAQP